ncbi:Pleckstrin likey domain-containing family M member 2 [Pseudolycoriella hygida]|uniref:Pleckstrin likey domain-containing family M member 2 n=1 Tax=Pseudolycoriella hygida TaxID=35572 RepID=A0A9Q0RXR2_9DIPT|nr:Pleckstrin likey domain-containing family M member 2 [Pseudolycoriella hygida]
MNIDSPLQLINHGQRDEPFYTGAVLMKDSFDDKMTVMNSSIVSNMDDSTPSDSGIQLLDSVSESIMSNSGLLELDVYTPIENISSTLPDLVLPAETAIAIADESKSFVMTKSDIDNSNVQMFDTDMDVGNIPDEMKTSTCSTFDTENIVYRRKTKKNRTHSTSGPKKRVSFHEDILKNTKTDNIHIEHGFITYKGYAKKTLQNGRYSWCSEGDDGDMKRNDQYLYRNACSDVLDYGNAEIYDKDANIIEYDNSGVFEYGPQENQLKNDEFYKCSCSDSNSSLDSGDSNDNVNRNYGQAKSNSCDCIGLNPQKILTNINDNCYFSEPNIESMDDSFDYIKPKSVWSKEKKPKTSCLKRQTGVIEEYDISEKVKTFNVHHLPDHMNNIIDNSKFLFGSLKNIFGIPLPERGVPEGCEDLQSVYECVPDVDNSSPVKSRTFLSKSFDGGLFKKNDKPKKYVHTVDELLRRKMEPTTPVVATVHANLTKEQDKTADDFVDLGESVQASPINFRNKYIINCESTVFEHTGVSYETENSTLNSTMEPTTSFEQCLPKPPAPVPFTEKISNIFKSFRDNSPGLDVGIPKAAENVSSPSQTLECMTSSVISNTSDNSNSTHKSKSEISITTNSPIKHRHLASPMRKRSMITRYENPRMSPDLFSTGRESKSLLSEEFDDILTITTSTDQTDSDIVIVDYPEPDAIIPNAQLLKPPSTKSSLINRFLRNVTQKKIQDATIKKNTFLAAKVKNDRKLFENIYVKGAKMPNADLIDDLNAEIALEIELSGKNSMASDLMRLSENTFNKIEYGVGVGEVSVDIFNPRKLNILRDEKETLMKVFKLYTGYSLKGHMTPVLIFLTDKTLYVTDLIRNRLTNKFVLPYSELDVILIGPHGNTVLLSNSARDMQQVLLAGGLNLADGLVSSLEMSARRGGSVLPAVGQLTLDHLAPLQAFVRENSSVSKNDPWVYYAVVSVPANVLNLEEEPLGPNMKGPLMFRNISMNQQSQPWEAGYFLLKAGVLYMFNDAHQKLPNMAIALFECKGARRAAKSSRPHCFELMLKTGFLQLAAPDEYVASEWLQSLVQAASGLFEMQEKHKTLGCTLVMTSNHLITLREDFTAPLRRVNAVTSAVASAPKVSASNASRKLSVSTITTDTMNDSMSSLSNSTNLSGYRVTSSNKSSPTRSQYNSTDEKSFSSMSSIYGKNSGVEIKTCAALEEMSTIRIPSQGDNWWCILEFSCQEVRENSDDMVIFFATNSDLRRFLTMLETMWQSKNNAPFPISILPDSDPIGKQCSDLFIDLNKSWDPLISAALGYPQ